MIINIYKTKEIRPIFVLSSNDFIVECNLHPLLFSHELSQANILFKPAHSKYILIPYFIFGDSVDFRNIITLQDLSGFNLSIRVNVNSDFLGSVNNSIINSLILIKSLVVSKEDFKSFIYDFQLENIFNSCFSYTRDIFNFSRLYLLKIWLDSYIPNTDKILFFNYSLNYLLKRCLR